jgi:glycosyltransferase involved in cell wall biosynthesis
MRVAVFHNLPSGGAKRALHSHIKYLSSTDNTVDVFVPSTADESYLPLKSLANELTVFPVKLTARGVLSAVSSRYLPISKLLGDVERVEREIAKTLNENKYDIVLCEQDRFVSAPFVLKHLESPAVYYCQQPPRLLDDSAVRRISEAGDEEADLSAVARSIEWYRRIRLLNVDKRNAAASTYTLANSYFSRESILRVYGINAFVSYLGVDTELFKPLSVPKERYVLSVGALLHNKGYEFIIRSLAKIERSVRPKLVIVCNKTHSNTQKRLARLSAELGVQLEIREQIKDEDLVLLYNKAMLVVYAPYLEPFGLVPLEAMACGTPVVAVKEGGVRESIQHAYNGLLTQRDEATFAEAVCKLLLDEDERAALSKNAVKSIHQKWTSVLAGQRLERHLKCAIDTFYGVR